MRRAFLGRARDLFPGFFVPACAWARNEKELVVFDPMPDVIEAIRMAKSPMTAKMVAKRWRDLMVVESRSSQDVKNMRTVLRLKLAQHHHLRNELVATGVQRIVEDCTKRPRGSALFWGAALKGGEWVGLNTLGNLWMELRDEIRDKDGAPSRSGDCHPSLAVAAA